MVRAISEGVSPAPVPSTVTTDAIDRAVNNAIDVLSARLEGQEKAVVVFQDNLTRVPTTVDRAVLGLREILEARLDAMEKDIVLVHQSLDKRESDITNAIEHLHSLVMTEVRQLAAVSSERFNRIDTQFFERDKRTDQLSLADKTAVAAALQAAKEAVGAQNTSNSIAIAKSESSTVESIRQLQTLFNSAIAAVNDKLNDVRSRIDRGDGNINGQSVAHVEHREEKIDSRGLFFGIFGIVVAIGAILVAIGTHLPR